MFERQVTRRIEAPIDEVFARLADVTSYGSWLPATSRSSGCHLTSPGPVAVGTTYVDETQAGPMLGEVVELDAPGRVVFRQRLVLDDAPVFEALQTNTLEATDTGTVLTHHFQGTFFEPFLELEPTPEQLAAEGDGERGIVLDALKALCEG